MGSVFGGKTKLATQLTDQFASELVGSFFQYKTL